MNYLKAIVLLLSGIVALAASFWLGKESGMYGFLLGYGYAALAGGLAGVVYSYFKKQNLTKQKKLQ